MILTLFLFYNYPTGNHPTHPPTKQGQEILGLSGAFIYRTLLLKIADSVIIDEIKGLRYDPLLVL
jgi:hypothetical protein